MAEKVNNNIASNHLFKQKIYEKRLTLFIYVLFTYYVK